MNGGGDEETWLSGWEKQCADEIEEQPDYEQNFITESDNSHRKIWAAFQESATAIAQLYRGRMITAVAIFSGCTVVQLWAFFFYYFPSFS